jgi:hypothetical protein
MSQDIEDTSNLHQVRGVFFLGPGGCPVGWWSLAGSRMSSRSSFAGRGVDHADVQVLDEKRAHAAVFIAARAQPSIRR